MTRIIMLALLLLGVSPHAAAYLDPGTGSMILQGIIAGVAVVGLTLKTYWYKIRLRRLDTRTRRGRSVLVKSPSATDRIFTGFEPRTFALLFPGVSTELGRLPTHPVDLCVLA